MGSAYHKDSDFSKLYWEYDKGTLYAVLYWLKKTKTKKPQ